MDSQFNSHRYKNKASLPLKSGKPDHPCDVMSRWRMVSFVRNDYKEWSPRILNVVGEGGNGPYRLYLDGNLRTEVDDFGHCDMAFDIHCGRFHYHSLDDVMALFCE